MEQSPFQSSLIIKLERNREGEEEQWKVSHLQLNDPDQKVHIQSQGGCEFSHVYAS